MKQRDTSLDIIRIIACILVVLMHSPLPSSNANGPLLCALSYFTAPCIGLFFMVSGALLLPVSNDYTTFLRKRFGKVIWPTVFWSFIYITINIFKSQDFSHLPQYVASLPFSAQGSGVLWFMYTLTGLYLLAPIISPWLEKARKVDLNIVLGLWVITLCYPLLKLFLTINETDTGILYYFSGYSGYFVLGYYLKRYPRTKLFGISLLIGVIGSVVLFYTKRKGIQIDFYSMFWYLSFFVAALCVFLWQAIKKLTNSLKTDNPFLAMISNLSFGIYLCHILIMRECLWHIGFIQNINNYILQTIVVALITLCLSIILCAVIAQTTLGKYLIGYTEQKK